LSLDRLDTRDNRQRIAIRVPSAPTLSEAFVHNLFAQLQKELQISSYGKKDRSYGKEPPSDLTLSETRSVLSDSIVRILTATLYALVSHAIYINILSNNLLSKSIPNL
jgi:hypothetical protein